jgi:hypothetical protein
MTTSAVESHSAVLCMQSGARWGTQFSDGAGEAQTWSKLAENRFEISLFSFSNSELQSVGLQLYIILVHLLVHVR